MPTARLRAGPLVATALLLGASVIVTTSCAVWATGEPDGLFTRDVRALAFDAGVDLPPYAGAVSLLTLMVWAAAAALTMCAGALDRDRRAWHLRLGGLLVVLAVDDAYMLHESTGATIVELGFYLVYASLGLSLLVQAVRRHHDASAVTFAAGLAFLGVSTMVDVLTHAQYLAEDGLKLVGALVLLAVPTLTLAGIAQTFAHERAFNASLQAALAQQRSNVRDGGTPRSISLDRHPAGSGDGSQGFAPASSPNRRPVNHHTTDVRNSTTGHPSSD